MFTQIEEDPKHGGGECEDTTTPSPIKANREEDDTASSWSDVESTVGTIISSEVSTACSHSLTVIIPPLRDNWWHFDYDDSSSDSESSEEDYTNDDDDSSGNNDDVQDDGDYYLPQYDDDDE